MKYDFLVSLLLAKIGLIKGIIFLLILGLLLNGCYSSKSISLRSQESLDKVNQEVSEGTAQVKLVDGESFKGKAVQVRKDSTFWRDAKTESTRYSIPTSELKSISTQKRNTLKGLGYGLLIGAATGAIWGASLGSDAEDCVDDEAYCIPRGGLALIGGITFGTGFGLIGLVSGALTKTTETYRFEDTEIEPEQ